MFAFCSPLRHHGRARFQQVPYDRPPDRVLCCIERERLEFEWLEVQTRERCLRRLRCAGQGRQSRTSVSKTRWPGWLTAIWSIGAAVESW